MRILQNSAAGLIIDIQERLFPHIAENEAVERNTNILIEGLSILDVPTLITEQYTKGLGTTISSIKNTMGGDYNPVEKIEFSCYDCRDFIEVLDLIGKKNIIIAGIETHVCVLQTALDLLAHGYVPIVIENCVSSRNLNDKKWALERILRSGGIVSTYESILFEICRAAGSDRFKSISKLVK